MCGTLMDIHPGEPRESRHTAVPTLGTLEPVHLSPVSQSSQYGSRGGLGQGEETKSRPGREAGRVPLAPVTSPRAGIPVSFSPSPSPLTAISAPEAS